MKVELDINDLNLIKQCIDNSQIMGKDAPTVAKVSNKIVVAMKKETEKQGK